VSPLEAAIRAVCRDIGANPDEWRGFLTIAVVGLTAFAEAVPAELGEQIRALLENAT
jgi:hypothetical protein